MRPVLILLVSMSVAAVANAAPLALRMADAPASSGSASARASTSAPASPATNRALSLRSAIDGALRNNVQALLADARRDAATGERVQARSAFLPHLSGEVSQSRQRTNLAAQGINFDTPDIPGAPAFPSVVTFNRFDARATLRQNLFNYSALQRYQGAKIGEQVAADQLAVAREQVAAQAALEYVSVLAAQESVAAAQADLDLAKQLVELAVDQENVGVGTGVDVTRAKSRLARSRAQLAQAHTDHDRSEIQLARTVGLSLSAPLELEDTLRYAPVALALAPVSQAVTHALTDRAEIALATAQIKRGRKQLAAARGQRLPTLSLKADYGDSGNTYDENTEGTYSIGAQVSIPIFSGGAVSGQIDSAASALDQQRIRYRDTRQQVEQDVRLSQRTLSTLAERVDAARAGLTLAKRELKQARDRFAHGVGNNIEVVDAQASLADARNTRVAALADYTRARINLAAALGRAQQFSLHESATP